MQIPDYTKLLAMTNNEDYSWLTIFAYHTKNKYDTYNTSLIKSCVNTWQEVLPKSKIEIFCLEDLHDSSLYVTNGLKKIGKKENGKVLTHSTIYPFLSDKARFSQVLAYITQGKPCLYLDTDVALVPSIRTDIKDMLSNQKQLLADGTCNMLVMPCGEMYHTFSLICKEYTSLKDFDMLGDFHHTIKAITNEKSNELFFGSKSSFVHYQNFKLIGKVLVPKIPFKVSKKFSSLRMLAELLLAYGHTNYFVYRNDNYVFLQVDDEVDWIPKSIGFVKIGQLLIGYNFIQVVKTLFNYRAICGLQPPIVKLVPTDISFSIDRDRIRKCLKVLYHDKDFILEPVSHSCVSLSNTTDDFILNQLLKFSSLRLLTAGNRDANMALDSLPSYPTINTMAKPKNLALRQWSI